MDDIKTSIVLDEGSLLFIARLAGISSILYSLKLLVTSSTFAFDITKSTLELLNSFENLNCESFKQKHKIEYATQLHKLIVNSDTLITYKIKQDTVKRKSENFTVERMYATLNNGDLMLIQDYVFNKVLITLNELKQ